MTGDGGYEEGGGRHRENKWPGIGGRTQRIVYGLDIQGKMNNEKYEVDSDFWPEQLNGTSYEDSKGQTILLLCLSVC